MRRRLFRFVVALSCLIAAGCSRDSGHFGGVAAGGPGPGPGPSPGPTPKPPIAISGNYCTIWTQGAFLNGAAPINVSCLQPDGSWQNEGGFPEAPPSSQYSYFYDASFGEAANGDLLLAYKRMIYPAPFNEELVVSRFGSGTGWAQVTSSDANASAGQLLSTYSQFGGQVFDFQNHPSVLWTQSTVGMLSVANGNTWTQSQVAPAIGNMFRHPDVLVSGDGTAAYLYYGEPAPTVWKFDGNNQTPLGGPTIDPSTEWTLYTSLVEWNGKLVLAYTSSDMPVKQNWAIDTDVTKIALFDGVNWNLISSGIQDTPGHDGSVPFLFVNTGTLYVMYGDYTTEGLPTTSNQLRFRFRVKSWNGSTWQQVGTESGPILFSQRHEFLNDGGTVLVHVTEPDSAATGAQESVIAWKAGTFGHAGNPIRALPKRPWAMLYRPGATIKLQQRLF